MKIRPQLISFRVVAFNAENRHDGIGIRWEIQLNKTSGIGIAVPVVQGGAIQIVVQIELNAQAHSENYPDKKAELKGEYSARFNCPAELTENMVLEWIESEANQYSLVSQAFPLAMGHLSKQLQATGLGVHGLPVGL